MCQLSENAKRYFLDELRQARLAAQKDAEGYDQLLFVFERMGSVLRGEAATLRAYRTDLLNFAKGSVLGKKLNRRLAQWHSEAETLYDLVNEARNDALHQGVRARHLTEHCIELALVFEDAIMNGESPMETIGDLMVRTPTTAELWQPVSFARQVMLTNSFSYLPICVGNEWRVVTDARIARFLRENGAAESRKQRLAMSLEDAHSLGLEFEDVCTKPPETKIKDVIKCLGEKPILVYCEKTEAETNGCERLVGIVTAFDIL